MKIASVSRVLGFLALALLPLARAAWTLDQMARGVPSQDWTKEPPEGLAAWAHTETMEIAA